METDTVMEIHVETQLLNRIAALDDDIPEVIVAALNMWLKEKHRLLNCPLTHDLCINLNSPCNDCSIVHKHSPL